MNDCQHQVLSPGECFHRARKLLHEALEVAEGSLCGLHECWSKGYSDLSDAYEQERRSHLTSDLARMQANKDLAEAVTENLALQSELERTQSIQESPLRRQSEPPRLRDLTREELQARIKTHEEEISNMKAEHHAALVNAADKIIALQSKLERCEHRDMAVEATCPSARARKRNHEEVSDDPVQESFRSKRARVA